MKKIVIGVVLALSGLMADDSGWYLGAGFGNTNADFIAGIDGATETNSDEGSSTMFKTGYYFNNNSRVTAFYEDISADDATMYLTGLGYDYLLGSYDVRPFVGATVGYGSFDGDRFDSSITGVVFGMQAGLNYRPKGQPFSIEAGYRFLKSTMKDNIDVSIINMLVFDVELQVDNFSTAYVGFDYRF